MLNVHLRHLYGFSDSARRALKQTREELARAGMRVSAYANGIRFSGEPELVLRIISESSSFERDISPSAAFALQSVDSHSALQPLVMNPVGVVRSPIKTPMAVDSMVDISAEIVIDQKFLEGLTGLVIGEGYQILFCFHQSQTYELEQFPRGDTSREKRGVFALRSPHRPNAIGITDVRLEAVDGNVLTVSGLDAIDGSPVLDIKPAKHGRSIP